MVAGPWAATYLADFGAEVIHVEGPPYGPPYADPTRVLHPLLPEGAPPEDQVSESWVQYGRNKLSLGLDVRHPLGKGVFLDLIARSDIWIDSSRPGTFARFGLSDRSLLRRNPRLVIVHLSGFGQTGDPRYIHRPSYDLIAQAFSGYLASQGNPPPEPPMRTGTAINDLVTGLAGATSAVMAYVHALRTGRGQVVDLAASETFFLMMENMALDFFTRGVVRGRHGNAHPRLHPYEIYPARDGWIVLAAPTPTSWGKLRDALGLPGGPQWDSMSWRGENRATVNERIEAFTRARTVVELEEFGVTHDIAISPILTMADIARNPHYRARRMLRSWTDPVLGRVTGAGIVPKFSRTPGRIWRGAPWVGQDNQRILGRILGYPSARLRRLQESGVIGSFRPGKGRRDAKAPGAKWPPATFSEA